MDRRHVERRAMLATLMFAGLRIGELCALRWRDVDLAAGWLHGRRVQDRRRPAAGEDPRRAPRRAARRSRAAPRRRPRTATCSRRSTGGRAEPRTTSAIAVLARGGRSSRTTNSSSGGLAAAAGRADAALAAPHVRSLLYALGEDPGVVHGRNGAHRPGARAAGVPAGDAPRRGREGASCGRWSRADLGENGRTMAIQSVAATGGASRLEAKALAISRESGRARQDSNLRPLAPEASALSTELRAPNASINSRGAPHARGPS